MRKLENTKGIGPGDVLMVHRQMTDKQTGKPYVWRFFGLVLMAGYNVVKTWWVSGPEGREQITVNLRDSRNTAYLLTPDEWPDGIHVFRTRLILQGDIDIS